MGLGICGVETTWTVLGVSCGNVSNQTASFSLVKRLFVMGGSPLGEKVMPEGCSSGGLWCAVVTTY